MSKRDRVEAFLALCSPIPLQQRPAERSTVTESSTLPDTTLDDLPDDPGVQSKMVCFRLNPSRGKSSAPVIEEDSSEWDADVDDDDDDEDYLTAV